MTSVGQNEEPRHWAGRPGERTMNARLELPPVSLIISSRGRATLLVEAVQSILDGDEVPSELIVIDQSDDENRQLVTMRSDRCELRYVHMDRVGVSLGRNEGVRMARHEILVFTDDDVLVARSWFGAIVRALTAEGERSIVTGRDVAGAPEQPGAFMWDTNDHEQRIVFEGRLDRDPLYPTNMALYRSSMEAVGLYDERLGPGARFPGAEDNDLGFRMLENGCRIVYVPDPVVTHRAWRPPDQFLGVKWRNAQGQGAYLAKHLSLRDRHMLRRLRRELGRNVKHSLRSLWLNRETRRIGHAHAVTSVGLVLGATKWLLLVTLPDRTRRLLGRRDRPKPR
jgi:glycosyltransferase involved in cell wall biosynthesis